MFDFLIVGAGIAGASLAWELASHGRVLLAEAEDQPGQHSTGRSAAMFMESYGPPQVHALTRASRSFYEQPPEGFSDTPILSPRGVLWVAWQGQEAMLEALWAKLSIGGSPVERLDAAATLSWMPVLRAEGLLGAIAEPEAMDIDVYALHQGYLRGARRGGAELRLGAELQQARRDGGAWQVHFTDGSGARARQLVNAAGAWADVVAMRCGVAPFGLQPKRRSAFTFDPPAGVDHRGWPAVCAVDESWYFKSDAGQLLGSPANADPTEAHDVQPEELDIALGIDGIQRHTSLRIHRPRRTWAGLRTFAPDGELVLGFDVTAPGFFWLAGQGGYGIQSAAGAAAVAAGLLTETHCDAAVRVNLQAIAPGRSFQPPCSETM